MSPWPLSTRWTSSNARGRCKCNATIVEDGGRFFARPGPDRTSYQLHGTEFDPTPVEPVTDQESCLLDVDFVVQADGRWWTERRHSFFGEFYLHNVHDPFAPLWYAAEDVPVNCDRSPTSGRRRAFA